MSSAAKKSMPTASSSTRAGPEALSMKEKIPANQYGSGNMLPFLPFLSILVQVLSV